MRTLLLAGALVLGLGSTAVANTINMTMGGTITGVNVVSHPGPALALDALKASDRPGGPLRV